MVLADKFLDFVQALENVEVATDDMGPWALFEEPSHLRQLFGAEAGPKRKMDHKEADPLDNEFLHQFLASVFQVMDFHFTLNLAQDSIILFAKGWRMAQG